MFVKGFEVEEVISQVQTQGYSIVKDCVDKKLLQELLDGVKSGDVSIGEGKDIPRLNKGSDFLYIPFLRDQRFFRLFREEPIDQVLQFFLNDKYYRGLDDKPNYILRAMICRSSKEVLPWHIDSFIPFKGDHVTTMQVVVPLEPFTNDNGPTLIMPGSHKSGEFAPQGLEDHSNVVKVLANPGDIVFWDSRIWHSATKNNTDNTRWAIVSTFTRWWIKQNYRFDEMLLKNNLVESFTDEDLIVLGIASITPSSHIESVEVKGGIERITTYREKFRQYG